MKTEYGSVCEGIITFLVYKKTKKDFLGVSKVWSRVWKPHFDVWFGRRAIMDYDTYVSSFDWNLENFVKSWPDIEEYFKWADIKQTELEQKAQEFRANIEKNKKVVYLTGAASVEDPNEVYFTNPPKLPKLLKPLKQEGTP